MKTPVISKVFGAHAHGFSFAFGRFG